MRQAGRYLPEYRELRARYGMLELCKSPDLATRVTLQPISRFAPDAAIIFADILLPLEGMGVPFHFAPDHGPVIEHPLRAPGDVDAVRVCRPRESLDFVLKSLSQVRGELDPAIALIGFAGAPFTLASYMIEGGPSKNFLHTKLFLYEHPRLWRVLMDKLVESTLLYLRAQCEAGAQALQLFDSWVGCLAPDDFRVFVAPYLQTLFLALASLRVPLIYFGTGTATLLPQIRDIGASVIGVDWRLSIQEARRVLGSGLAVQGNLDPLALLAPGPVLEAKVEAVLEDAAGEAGHIFNLGHGILPTTPVDNVARVFGWVREKSAAGRVSPTDSGQGREKTVRGD